MSSTIVVDEKPVTKAKARPKTAAVPKVSAAVPKVASALPKIEAAALPMKVDALPKVAASAGEAAAEVVDQPVPPPPAKKKPATKKAKAPVAVTCDLPLSEEPLPQQQLVEVDDSSSSLILSASVEDAEDDKNHNKKRGRKPKGGKIIVNNMPLDISPPLEPNIVMHLKCGRADLVTGSVDTLAADDMLAAASSLNATTATGGSAAMMNSVDSYQFSNHLGYELLSNPTANILLLANDEVPTDRPTPLELAPNEHQQIIIRPSAPPTMASANNASHAGAPAMASVQPTEEMKVIWQKLKELTYRLHNNNIDKKAACFWCTFDFDNPPIFLPKYELNNTYYCYGCFCSPECATAFLFKETIDSSARFERYHMLNHIYSKIYAYTKNIKPAPDPYYTLNKYYGNLTIQEYRRLLKNERLMLVVDKPLCRTLPEIFEDSEDLLFSGKTIPPASNFKLRRNVKQSKNEILQGQFNGGGA